MLRVLCCVLLAALLIASALGCMPRAATYTLSLASPTPPEVSARAAILMEAGTGLVLTEKNADERLPMASTTKIMTALVVLEQLPLDMTVAVPPEAVGVEGSSVYLYAGERLTVETLLYALLLSSANDAAVALALTVSESVEAFAALMNERAATLGLTNTHFCNPHGLHSEEHYTTARDLARLFSAAMQNADFARISATKRHTQKQDGTDATRLFLNHNRLLGTLDGACGGKTGFTRAAGRCLASAARRNGLLLVAVTLQAPNDWQDHRALLEFGFASYEQYTPSPSPISVPVVGGERKHVALLPTASPSLPLPRGTEVECTLELPRFLFGGFAAGEVRGRLIYRAGGEVIAEIPLATAEPVAAERPRSLISRLFKKIRFRTL